MNDNIDLTKILKGCPKGTKLYSSSYGEVEFESIDYSLHCPIKVTGNMYYLCFFTKEGKLVDTGECTLFPSRTQRDWSKFERFWDESEVERFDPKTLQPFDKVLVRNSSFDFWGVEIFGYIDDCNRSFCTNVWQQCIPYNDDTKCFLGTSDDCPEYYRWWEE